MRKTKDQIIDGLKREINSTLLFFVAMDFQMFGIVTDDTKEAFKKQGVKFPESLNTHAQKF